MNVALFISYQGMFSAGLFTQLIRMMVVIAKDYFGIVLFGVKIFCAKSHNRISALLQVSVADRYLPESILHGLISFE